MNAARQIESQTVGHRAGPVALTAIAFQFTLQHTHTHTLLLLPLAPWCIGWRPVTYDQPVVATTLMAQHSPIGGLHNKWQQIVGKRAPCNATNGKLAMYQPIK